jgi:hypothetical protein
MNSTSISRAWFAAVALALSACDASSDGDELPALTREELQNPESCKDCHPKHYEQWSASMHAYAAADPVFLAMNKRGQAETGGTLGPFCVSCHAPMAVQAGMTDFANVESLPPQLKGVTCYFCHNAIGVGDKHVNGNVLLANDNVMRAAVSNPVEPTTHKVAYSTFHDPRNHESSLLCGTCHDLENSLGVRLERTYEEYQGSIFASDDPSTYRACPDCHMTRLRGGRQQIAEKTGRSGDNVLARDVHEHLWQAVDVPLTAWPHADAMRSAVGSCNLPAAMSAYITLSREAGPLGQLTVELEADTGHMFPSGAAQDRRLWMELIAYDQNLSELYRMGQVGEQELEETGPGQHPCMFREYLADANGHETHDFWEAATITKSKLMPVTPKGTAIGPRTHTATCNFRPPVAQSQVAPAFVDMRLRMRPMGMDVLNDLVSTGHLAPDVPAQMPTFTVFSRRATYIPESPMYGVPPLNDDPTLGDCRTYLCLLDPQNPECPAD